MHVQIHTGVMHLLGKKKLYFFRNNGITHTHTHTHSIPAACSKTALIKRRHSSRNVLIKGGIESSEQLSTAPLNLPSNSNLKVP